MIIAGVAVILIGLWFVIGNRRIARGLAARETIGGIWAHGRASPTESQFRISLLAAGFVFAGAGVVMVFSAVASGRL